MVTYHGYVIQTVRYYVGEVEAGTPGQAMRLTEILVEEAPSLDELATNNEVLSEVAIVEPA